MRAMKLLAVLLLLGFFVLLIWNPALSQNKVQKTKMKTSGMGEHLVTICGCDDCHSPKTFTATGPQVDGSKRLSGHPAGDKIPAVPQGVLAPDKWGALTTNDLTAWVGPWGVSYTFNLTPDKETGLGGWTLDTFKKVLRTGKDVSGKRDILPPMPWFEYAGMSDVELKAMYDYLRSLPAISNAVPAPVPPPQMTPPAGTTGK